MFTILASQCLDLFSSNDLFLHSDSVAFLLSSSSIIMIYFYHTLDFIIIDHFDISIISILSISISDLYFLQNTIDSTTTTLTQSRWYFHLIISSPSTLLPSLSSIHSSNLLLLLTEFSLISFFRSLLKCTHLHETFLCYPNKITTPPSQHFLFQLQFFIALFFIWYSICFSCLFNNLLNTFLIHSIHSKSAGLCSFVATLLHRKSVQCTFVEIMNEQMNRCYPHRPQRWEKKNR